MRKINKANFIILFSLFFLPFFVVIFTLKSPPKEIIHKTINYDKYDIVIVSRTHFSRLSCNRKLYAEVWSNHKQINNYYIVLLDAPDDYDERIKDITILPDTEVIMVEFTDPGRMRSGNAVELYKIAGTEAAGPAVTVP